MLFKYKYLLFICIYLISFVKTQDTAVLSSSTSSFVTSSCNFTFNNNIYDLSPLTLTDGSSYKASYSFLKLDFIFNICGYTKDCNNKYSNRRYSQACSIFPLPTQVGDPSTETVVENSNGITISYTGSDYLCSRSNQLNFICDQNTSFKIIKVHAYRCKYIVNIHSKYACPTPIPLKPTQPPKPRPLPNPSQCFFLGNQSDNNTFYNLSRLILPNNNSYRTQIGYIDQGLYKTDTLFFSICGEITICQNYPQFSAIHYQSCLIKNQSSLPTGSPLLVNTYSTNRGITLVYQTDTVYQECKSNISLVLLCSSVEFKILQSSGPVNCGYQINILSKYACPITIDDHGASHSESLSSSSSTSSSEDPNSNCILSTVYNAYVYNLSPLILPNGGYYNASFKISSTDSFNLLFSVCGNQVDVCKHLNQLSGNSSSYQSCQVYNNQYAIQTGVPSQLSYITGSGSTSLTYSTSNGYQSINRQNKIIISCNSSTEFNIVSTNFQNATNTYQVNVDSKYGCPCAFRNPKSGATFDLSPLILPNNGAYNTTIGYMDHGNYIPFTVYFSVCGKASICNQYQSNGGDYQSCQVTQTNLAQMIAVPSNVDVKLYNDRIQLVYSSSPQCGSTCSKTTLQLICDENADFNMVSSFEFLSGQFQIDARTKYACPQGGDSSKEQSTSDYNSSSSADSTSEEIDARCFIEGPNNNHYDLTPLALPNGGSYSAAFTGYSDGDYTIYFSICGKARVCQDNFIQLSGNKTSYQSCQIYSGKYAVQTGDTSGLNLDPTLLTSNSITLTFASNNKYFGCERSQKVTLTCDPTTDFKITGTKTEPCIYTVFINSRYACPKSDLPSSEQSSSDFGPRPSIPQCIFNLTNNIYFDLSPLSKRNNGYYNVSFNPNNEGYTLLFTICGDISNICETLVQMTGNTTYQSCQVYAGLYSYQTGIPSLVTATTSPNTITLIYESNIQFSGCKRKNVLFFTCDKSVELKITSSSSPYPCVYQINFNSKFACPKQRSDSSLISDSLLLSTSGEHHHHHQVQTSCKFTDQKGTTFDLSPLMNDLSYRVLKVNSSFTLYYSICGTSVDICKDFIQMTGNASAYQSCLVYQNKYSYQTGIPTSGTYSISPDNNQVTLNFKSNISYAGCTRGFTLTFICDPSVVEETMLAQSESQCIYQIISRSKHSCPK